MKKEIAQSTREQRIKRFIASRKFLSNSKYHKTNKISCAHFESWAARGQAGGCRLCNCGHYNYTIHNKRYTTTSRNSNRMVWHYAAIGKLCSECYAEVEKQCNYEFKKY